MHVLLIHQSFATPAEAGGTRHFEFGKHLVRKGNKITIITSNLNYLTGMRVARSKPGAEDDHKEVIDGVRIHRVYTYPALHRSYLWRVISFLSFVLSSIVAGLRTRDVDMVVGTSPPLPQACSAWLVAALKRRPLLLEIRDLWPDFAIDMGILTNPLLVATARMLERFLYKHATHILVNSPAYQSILMEKGVPEEKISLIPNGVDATMFDVERDKQSLREELNLGDRFVVTYSGALGEANDIPTLLKAADRLRNRPDIVFLLVGDGKKRVELESIVERNNLENVLFIGSRPKSEIPGILAASDACVAILQDIPMFMTTYPNKLFDYMAAGRPIIMAIDGVARSVVENADCGVISRPGEAADIVKAVELLADARDEAREMGIRGRDYVVRHFNRRDHAEAFSSLCERLVHNPNDHQMNED